MSYGVLPGAGSGTWPGPAASSRRPPSWLVTSRPPGSLVMRCAGLAATAVPALAVGSSMSSPAQNSSTSSTRTRPGALLSLADLARMQEAHRQRSCGQPPVPPVPIRSTRTVLLVQFRVGYDGGRQEPALILARRACDDLDLAAGEGRRHGRDRARAVQGDVQQSGRRRVLAGGALAEPA